MANHSRGQDGTQTLGTRTFTEPEVRRWPHPVEPAAERTTEPALQYIQCALSYQNQLLAEIKSLLEELAAEAAETNPNTNQET
jgi:hypothetical protein